MLVERTPSRRFTRRSTGDRLLHAVQALADDRGQLLAHTEKSWASVTFAGTRHSLVLLFSGADAVAAAEDLIARLPDHEFRIPGQLVADAAVAEVDHRVSPHPRMIVTCELLLLEDE